MLSRRHRNAGVTLFLLCMALFIWSVARNPVRWILPVSVRSIPRAVIQKACASKSDVGSMFAGFSASPLHFDGHSRLGGYGFYPLIPWFGRFASEESARAPLRAKAAALGIDKELLVVLVTLDVVGIDLELSHDVRESVQAEFKNKYACVEVIVVASHTHSSVDSFGLWGVFPWQRGPDTKIINSLTASAKSAAREAEASRREARFRMVQAPAMTSSGDNVAHSLWFENARTGKTLGSITRLSGHPAVEENHHILSADFHGHFAIALSELSGGTHLVVPGVLGASFPLEVASFALEGHAAGYGRHVAGEMARAAAQFPTTAAVHGEKPGSLSISRQTVNVPMSNRAFRLLQANGTTRAGRRLDCPSGGCLLSTEMSILTLEGQTLAFMPGEIHAGLARAVCERTGALAVSMADDWLGYLYLSEENATDYYRLLSPSRGAGDAFLRFVESTVHTGGCE